MRSYQWEQVPSYNVKILVVVPETTLRQSSVEDRKPKQLNKGDRPRNN